MLKKIGKIFNMFICAVLVFQLVGCGTILYPERKGQKSGKIDIGVALLDGIGLLFFLIPGVIAYAIDFNNGTIYLPGTFSRSFDIKDIREVKFDPKHSSIASIEKIIKNETGFDVKLNQSNMTVSRLNSVYDMMAHFSQALPGIQNVRIVLLND
ncbi:MAG: hypothetical protein PHV17_03240 [Candidatus Omnitrophica bacterium]|nr:hypothetical protein [Candidatus Omnitrophota bacterium]